eukprot:6539342-Pyramimonas_sp.AAC.5
MENKDYIILCLEDTSDWSNATTRNLVLEVCTLSPNRSLSHAVASRRFVKQMRIATGSSVRARHVLRSLHIASNTSSLTHWTPLTGEFAPPTGEFTPPTGEFTSLWRRMTGGSGPAPHCHRVHQVRHSHPAGKNIISMFYTRQGLDPGIHRALIKRSHHWKIQFSPGFWRTTHVLCRALGAMPTAGCCPRDACKK